MSSNIVWFDEMKGDYLSQAGGKGASLCKMVQAGMEVPEGFIVTTSMFKEYMKRKCLFSKIQDLIKSIDFEDKSSIQEISEKIQRLIIENEMPDDMKEEIAEVYSKLGEDGEVPVAVRSSSTAEDLDTASFAGQQETFLYVIGKEDLIEKVKECWASLYAGRAIFYRKQKQFDEANISIAVVVQKMINSEKSGVMFTVNPITKIKNQAVIEASWGLGEAVVSGLVTPDSYIVDKNSGEIVNEFISEKEDMIVRKESGKGTVQLKVPEEKKNMKVLDEREISQLIEFALKVEDFFGNPQDVEWATENGRVYILQSRPITTL